MPEIKAGNVRDETGCGDQVTAVLSALTWKKFDIKKVCQMAVLAGTMQFYRSGISPITEKELQEQNT